MRLASIAVLLVIVCLVLPILIAGLLSFVGGIGAIEMMLLYGLCIIGASVVWRSIRRRAMKR